MRELRLRCAIAVLMVLAAAPAAGQWASLGAMPASAPGRAQPHVPQSPRHRRCNSRRARHLPHSLRAGSTARTRSLLQRGAGTARRPGRSLQGLGRPVNDRHIGAADDDPPQPLSHRDRRRAGQLARRRRSAEWHRVLGKHGAGVEAAARRRARLRPRREDRRSEQARPQARWLQLHDVEQRHLRATSATPIRSTCRCRSSSCCAAGGRHGIFLDNTFRSNFDVGHQSEGLAVVRRRRRRARLLLHQRARSQERAHAVHGAHRPDAAAAAMGARLSPVPLQLLPGVEGPIHRARTSASGGSPPTCSGSTSTTSTATTRSRGIVSGFRIPPALDRRSAPRGIPNRASSSIRIRRRQRAGVPYDSGLAGRSVREEPRRHGLRSAGVAVTGGTESGARACFPTSASRRRASGGARCSSRCSTSASPASGTT